MGSWSGNVVADCLQPFLNAAGVCVSIVDKGTACLVASNMEGRVNFPVVVSSACHAEGP